MNLQSRAHPIKRAMTQRSLRSTALEIFEEASCACAGGGRMAAPTREDIAPRLEMRFVSACWTLRRLPDREAGYLRMRGALWPETAAEPGTYARDSLTSFQARRQVRISALEIDQMQPTLDLLLLLPEIEDRQLLFWAAWHQDGECSTRIPWAKVRRSLDVSWSRWTLKRRYDGALLWLAGLVEMQGRPRQ
ncbi:hypothetical protein [Kordiimonas lacus]|uniref:Uncharacterized protein n=1 Tax=Kordiimonas lacus TaxID=637679 RepID=A0A1G7ACP1_9PROT|nr:hypothetical protein [Kordiimonas lacus]SDE12463.1 hypothetical protein SAMN04488071_2176 [Kordiimonas lacus]